MFPVLDQCEWHPGSNRSVVSIEQAVLQVPAEDRAELVSRFNRSDYDDVVVIKRDSVRSGLNRFDYAPAIEHMNFGSGSLCQSVTRWSWTSDDEQQAMVFHVGSHVYGYAAACGNLFMLTGAGGGVALAPAILARSFEEAVATRGSPAGPPAEATPADALEQPPAAAWSQPGAFIDVGWSASSGSVLVEACCCDSIAVVPTPVPEPATWALTLLGLFAFRLHRKPARAHQ